MRRIFGEGSGKPRRLFWILLLIGLIGTASAIVVLTFQGNVNVIVGPNLVASQTVFDFGTMAQGDSKTLSFTLTNDGDSVANLVCEQAVPTGLMLTVQRQGGLLCDGPLTGGASITMEVTLEIATDAPIGLADFTWTITGSL